MRCFAQTSSASRQSFSLPADFSLSSDAFPLMPSLHRLGAAGTKPNILFFTRTHSLTDRRSSTSCPLFFWLSETLTPWSGPLPSPLPTTSLLPTYPCGQHVNNMFPPFQSGSSPNTFSSISIPFQSAALPPSLASPPHPILQQRASTGSCVLNEDSRDEKIECNHLNQRRTYKTYTMTSRHIKITVMSVQKASMRCC